TRATGASSTRSQARSRPWTTTDRAPLDQQNAASGRRFLVPESPAEARRSDVSREPLDPAGRATLRPRHGPPKFLLRHRRDRPTAPGSAATSPAATYRSRLASLLRPRLQRFCAYPWYPLLIG